MCHISPERRVLDLESEILLRGLGSILTGVTFCLWFFCFCIVKLQMPILALLAISSCCEKNPIVHIRFKQFIVPEVLVLGTRKLSVNYICTCNSTTFGTMSLQLYSVSSTTNQGFQTRSWKISVKTYFEQPLNGFWCKRQIIASFGTETINFCLHKVAHLTFPTWITLGLLSRKEIIFLWIITKIGSEFLIQDRW